MSRPWPTILLPLLLVTGVVLAAPSSAKQPQGLGAVVRPGMAIYIELPDVGTTRCTLAFLFARDGSSKAVRHGVVRKGNTVFATTAGHCALVNQATGTEEVHAPVTGPVVRLAVVGDSGLQPGPRLGRVAYAAQQVPVAFEDENLATFADLSLIALDRGVRIDPQVCLFGGPTGLAEAPPAPADAVRVYGQGEQTGVDSGTGEQRLPGRSAVVAALQPPTAFTGTSYGPGGDSGAPFIDSSGRAAGLQSGPYASVLAASLPRAAQRLGFELDLLTAPVEPVTVLLGADPACAAPRGTS